MSAYVTAQHGNNRESESLERTEERSAKAEEGRGAQGSCHGCHGQEVSVSPA